MSDVHLKMINSVSMKIIADPGIIMEIADNFTYFAPNYKYHPKVKARMWDGKISCVHRLSGVCYVGLAQRIKKFCDARDYTISFDEGLAYSSITRDDLKEFIETLNLPHSVRDYQFESIFKCIRSHRRTLLSPTSSGKSLIIYVIVMWYITKYAIKPLVIVPTIGLVTQMESDFVSYGFKGISHCSTSKLSKALDIPADVVITTWQSIESGKRKMDPLWYKQFGAVFGDEAHGCSAATLLSILSSMTETKYRFGTTGTLAEEPLSEANIVGLFGPTYKSISTKDMIDSGFASKLKIKCIVMKYTKEECKLAKDFGYPEEINFIINHEARAKLLNNLVLNLKGNTLVFFRMTDHGQLIYKNLKESAPDKSIFYIDGGTSGSDREQIRNILEHESNAALVASMGTTSTGVSVNRLKNMIAGSPSKSKIKVLQAIGRMLRLHEEKKEEGAILYDLVDDMSTKGHRNYTLNHFVERVKIYESEGFDYQIVKVDLK